MGEEEQWAAINGLKSSYAELDKSVGVMAEAFKQQKEQGAEILKVVKETQKTVDGNGNYKEGLRYRTDKNSDDIKDLQEDKTVAEMKTVYKKGKNYAQVFRFLLFTKLGRFLTLMMALGIIAAPYAFAWFMSR